jgi:hypothetical protein
MSRVNAGWALDCSACNCSNSSGGTRAGCQDELQSCCEHGAGAASCKALGVCLCTTLFRSTDEGFCGVALLSRWNEC